MRKVILVVLFIIAGFAFIACSAPDGLEYSIDRTGVTITGYTGNATTLAIPAEIRGLPVTRIGEGAFSGCTNLAYVIIPDTVTVIDSSAFPECYDFASFFQGMITGNIFEQF